MMRRDGLRVAYVLKRYPTFSETFIVNEILAHEAARLSVEIFSLWPTIDTHFQDRLSRVRAPVTHVPRGPRTSEFWQALESCAAVLPELWTRLGLARGEDSTDVYQAIWVARELIARRIHHVHAHFAAAATSVARLASRVAGVPYTFTAHAKDIFHQSVQSDAFARKLEDAAAAVTVSDYNVGYLKERYGASAANVRRVYNGLDLHDFPYRPPDERPSRIVAVGRLVAKKGFADLIAACEQLASKSREFSCQIVGTGTLETELRARIKAANLERRVELLGARPQGELAGLLQGAAVLAAPCVLSEDGDRDGLPTVLLEAMALGTPCVSTDVTGIPEVVRHGETGLIVPQRDPAVLAASLDRLLSDASLRVRLATGARRLIEAEFDIHRNAAQLRDIFGGRADASPRLALKAG